jgi:hypothetical protein
VLSSSRNLAISAFRVDALADWVWVTVLSHNS